MYNHEHKQPHEIRPAGLSEEEIEEFNEQTEPERRDIPPRCPDCNGSGFGNGYLGQCERCNGTGESL